MLSVKAMMYRVQDRWQEDWFKFPCGWTISSYRQIEVSALAILDPENSKCELLKTNKEDPYLIC